MFLQVEMPRSSSSRSGARSFSSTRPTVSPITAPKPVYLPKPVPRPAALPAPSPMIVPSAPAPASFGQIVKEGFGFGVGAHVARHAVDGVFNALGSAFQQAPGAPRPFTDESRYPYTAKVDDGDMTELYKQCVAYKNSTKCGGLSDAERHAWIQCMKESKYDDKACDHLY